MRTISTPIGDLGLVASRRGLTRVLLDPAQGLAELARTRSLERSLGDAEGDDDAESHLGRTAAQLLEYFAGKRKHFSLLLDLSEAPDSFRTKAQLGLALIPYGQTVTYRDLAEALGAPGAARAVGSACATNPLPLVLPCQRVVRADGSVGRYAGGEEKKLRLLQMEAANAG